MRHKDVPVESVPEVRAFVEAQEMLEAFVENNQGVFQAYFQLLDTVKQKQEAADKTVRAKGVSCGPWELYQYQTKVNAEAMFNALGMEAFLRLGGSTTTKTIYEADKAKVEAAIARGDISPDLGETFIERSPRYHSPKGG